MIPLKLQIKNFLSYGPEIQTIEFGEYPLICLSGKNGHGKSALLDALTWALWGQARKTTNTAKADQGLLRLGQTQMMVCLDFVCNNQHYRVRREFAQTYGKPYAALDFGLLDNSNDRFISLTDKTIRETQEKIDSMLHLNYDAFINSAFLRQGHANEFSKKAPRDRKEILASILGLDQYEVIRRRAAEKSKIILTQKTSLIAVHQKIQQELEQTNTLNAQLQLLQEKQQKLCVTEQEIVHKQKNVLAQKAQLQVQEQELHMLTYKQTQIMQQEHKLLALFKATASEWRSIHKQQLLSADIPSLENKKKELSTHINEFQTQLQEQLQIKEQILVTKEHLQQQSIQLQEKQQGALTGKKVALERLTVEKQHLENQLQHTDALLVTAHAQQKLKEQEYAHLQVQLALFNEAHIRTIEKQFEKRKEHYQRWIAQANHLKNELDTIEQKYSMVHDEQAPSCPLCEQNLSASRRRFLKKKFDEECTFFRHRFKRLSMLIKQIKPLLIEQHSALEQQRKLHQEHLLHAKTATDIQLAQKKQQELIRELEEQQCKYKELLIILQATYEREQKAVEEHIQQCKNELQQDEQFQILQKKLRDFEQQLKTQPYSPEKHQQTILALQAIEKTLASYHLLQQEQALQAQRMNQVGQLCHQLKDFKKEKAQLQAQCNALNNILTKKQTIKIEEEELSNHMQQLMHEKEQLVHEKGSLETHQKKLLQLKQEHQQQEKEIAECEQLISDYSAIATATGKDGIQALLIEDAIPEIEHEANELLAKLTENQMQLFIESLRDLKKGGTKETLDIKISDTTGIRPYELFSGGEAFRIDFALRIAISKLLARRAGTSLQTLIIDEGFGSQDEEGLSHIMDALYKIQEDFAKIIIVSHLHSMKNQFPVHFLVEKGPNGSMISVIEQG